MNNQTNTNNTIDGKQINSLIGITDITRLKSFPVKKAKPVKIKVVKRPSINEMITSNYSSEIDNSTPAECSIQSVLNSCHPDIKSLYNHNNVLIYKVTADSLELKLNTGISITIFPNKTRNWTQVYNNSKTKHSVHQTRYLIKDKNNKVILDKKG